MENTVGATHFLGKNAATTERSGISAQRLSGDQILNASRNPNFRRKARHVFRKLDTGFSILRQTALPKRGV